MADPTEDAVKREIAKARRIIQSDLHAAELRGLSERFDKHFPDNSDKEEDGDKPKPPPAVPPKEEPVKRGLWWGENV